MKKLLPLMLCALCAVPSFGQRLNGSRYRGFAEGLYMTGVTGSDYDDNNLRGWGFSTTHGCQFNRYIFVGGGFAYYRAKCSEDGYYYSSNSWYGYSTRHYTQDTYYNIIPIYSDFRVHMARSRVSPFFDVKLGATISEEVGVFVSPSLGLRIGMSDDVGINITAGYTSMSGIIDADTYSSAFTVSVGIDF